MLSVDQAWGLLKQHAAPLSAEEVSTLDANGLCLAETVTSPIDSPPFDKSMVDGYAVIAGDTGLHRAVVEEVVAGQTPSRLVAPGEAVRIMTGAPMPKGADAVVKREDTDESDPAFVGMLDCKPKPGKCVMHRGAAFQSGETLLQPPKKLGPADLALLTEIGRVSVRVVPRPKAALLPTGDELVPFDQAPAPGQIRNSNGPMLTALLADLRVPTENLGIGRDDPEDLARRIEEGLQRDVLILSGGVSAGDKDLVPDILESLGVRKVLHKVRVKPGKPIWFGVREKEGRRSLVFGLPGNPVSAFVAFHLFVRPMLSAVSGEVFQTPMTQPIALAKEVSHKGPRPTYQPAIVRRDAPQATVEVLPWVGSADLSTLSRANALAALPAGDYRLRASELVEILPLC
ncbi:MAG: gephyrin-like molybdotransferase Glp [Planctomycetota bacterium]